MYSDPPQAMLFRLPGQFDGTHIHKPVKEDKSDLSSSSCCRKEDLKADTQSLHN